ncbi:hypothetical protein [Vagococcus fessus]|uniref:Uncharacterized protein n=1 Tax=Vagococcus fessus TaxID=120370 RepID=A0A430A565_9ENTE|nr:hypothetical protein [Vagococcus fessus]RSU01955.1 hypothetical protein CBF31_09315 [Vagococcus fessus]
MEQHEYTELLETLDKVRQSKDLDEIHQTVLSIFSICGLTVSEVASLLTSLMRNVLNQEHNAKYLKDVNGINAEDLTAEQVLAIQNLLVSLSYNGQA